MTAPSQRLVRTAQSRETRQVSSCRADAEREWGEACSHGHRSRAPVKFTRPRLHVPDFPRRRLVVRSLPVLLVSAAIALLVFGGKHTSDPHAISLTQLVLLVKSGRIVALETSDAGGRATDRSGEVFSFNTPRDQSTLKVLSNFGASADELSGIAYSVADPHCRGWIYCWGLDR